MTPRTLSRTIEPCLLAGLADPCIVVCKICPTSDPHRPLSTSSRIDFKFTQTGLAGNFHPSMLSSWLSMEHRILHHHTTDLEISLQTADSATLFFSLKCSISWSPVTQWVLQGYVVNIFWLRVS